MDPILKFMSAEIPHLCFFSLLDLALDHFILADQSRYVYFILSCLFQNELLHLYCRTLQRQ
jgi:hypothetical protein